MSTVKDTFRDAISSGDWNQICRVFTALTGEAAPVPPTAQEPSLSTLLEQPMDDPLSAPMDGPEPTIEDDDDGYWSEDDLIADEEEAEPEPDDTPQVFVPPEPDNTPDADDPASEFYIEHGDAAEENEDGERRCRREPMRIPRQRTNRFRDNGKAFADEKVTVNDDPKLGVQKIRPRGNRDANKDTGKKVKVQCSLCDKKEEVAARLAVGYSKKPDDNTYKCNSCNSPSGRAKVMRRKREEQLNGGARRRRQ
jgi:uncharacterized protein YlaI